MPPVDAPPPKLAAAAVIFTLPVIPVELLIVPLANVELRMDGVVGWGSVRWDM